MFMELWFSIGSMFLAFYLNFGYAEVSANLKHAVKVSLRQVLDDCDWLTVSQMTEIQNLKQFIRCFQLKKLKYSFFISSFKLKGQECEILQPKWRN